MAGFDNTQFTSANQQNPEGNAQLSQSAYSGSLPWRATYGQIAPLAQQAIDNAQQGYPNQNPNQNPNYASEYSNNVGNAPIIYSPGTYYAQQQQGYDTGTHGVPPSSIGPNYGNPNPQSSAFNPGDNGGGNGDPNIYPQNYAFQPQRPTTTDNQGYQGYQQQQQQPGSDQQSQTAQQPGGTQGNTYGYSPYAPGANNGNAFAVPGSTSESQLPSVSVIGSAIMGGAGAVAGKYFIPNAINSLADRQLGTTTVDGPTLFSSAEGASKGGLLSKLWGKDAKIIPDSWKQKVASEAASTADKVAGGPKVGEVKNLVGQGVKYDLTQWQNGFAPQYATRTAFQDMLDSNSGILKGLVDKSGLSTADAQELARLNYISNAIKSGEIPGRMTAANAAKLEDLTKQSGLSAEEINNLTSSTYKQQLLGAPGALDQVNPKLFSATDGPALVDKLKKGPFSEGEMSTIDKQGNYFDSLSKDASTTTTATKDQALLARPGIGEFAKGALLIGGTTVASDMIDNWAGGPNALHLSNYGLMGAFLAGDTLQQKAVYMGGTLAANYVLDKVLPASSHTTISNIMRPTGWDSMLQGAALFLPAADNSQRLAAMGAAWGVGRLANMNFLPSLATTGVIGAGTGFLLRADPEAAAGAIVLEAGAWGVSRIMHAL